MLRPPSFDSQRPACMNFGAIGSVIMLWILIFLKFHQKSIYLTNQVIGHEITHGFDDEGIDNKYLLNDIYE